MNLSSRYSNSNFVHILLFIDHSSRCKLKVYIITYDQFKFFAKLERRGKSKEWAQFVLGCLLLIFIYRYSSSKFKVTCKNGDFECRYITTHTKEKLFKISNITFAILHFHQKNTQTEWHPEYFETYYSWRNHQMCFRMVHFNVKMQNLEFVNLQCVTYAQPISLALREYCTSYPKISMFCALSQNCQHLFVK